MLMDGNAKIFSPAQAKAIDFYLGHVGAPSVLSITADSKVEVMGNLADAVEAFWWNVPRFTPRMGRSTTFEFNKVVIMRCSYYELSVTRALLDSNPEFWTAAMMFAPEGWQITRMPEEIKP